VFDTRQTQRIIKGIFTGSAVGGVIGNQKKKSVEGFLIGGTICGMIGSETGKNQDFQREQEKEAALWERQKAIKTIERQKEIQKRERRVTVSPPQQFHSYQGSADPYNDPEVVAARHRAERAEMELQRLEEARRRESQPQKILAYTNGEKERQPKGFFVIRKGSHSFKSNAFNLMELH